MNQLRLDDFTEPLRKFNPKKVVLFGSYVYGKPTKDSDVDLLVIVDTDKKFHDRISQMRPLLPKDKPIDLIILTPSEYQKARNTNSLLIEIESKGKVIYG